MTATWSAICVIEWSGDLYASRVSVSCPPRVSSEALRSLLIIRLWFQLSLIAMLVTISISRPPPLLRPLLLQTCWRLSTVNTKTCLLPIQYRPYQHSKHINQTGLKQWQMKIVYYYFTSYHALQHLTNTSIPSQLILSIVWGIWIIHVFSILWLNWNKRYGAMILLLELT